MWTVSWGGIRYVALDEQKRLHNMRIGERPRSECSGASCFAICLCAKSSYGSAQPSYMALSFSRCS